MTYTVCPLNKSFIKVKYSLSMTFAECAVYYYAVYALEAVGYYEGHGFPTFSWPCMILIDSQLCYLRCASSKCTISGPSF